MTGFGTIYLRWQRDRLRSTVTWTLGIIIIAVVTAAFYPSLSGSSTPGEGGASSAMSSFLGLGQGINPKSPLGYLWIGLFANVYPWMLMALGVALGVAAIAGDEDTGALEYLLSKPVTRTTVALARLAGVVTILAVASFLSAVALIIFLPVFDLDTSMTATTTTGTVTYAGATGADILNGAFSSFAVAIGIAGVAYLIGGVSGRRGLALGISSAIGIGGYVLYTLSNMTGSLKALTWLSPWRWYVDQAMLINGLHWEVALPFATATVAAVVGWLLFLRRDLQTA